LSEEIHRVGEVGVHALRGVDLASYEGEFMVLLGRLTVPAGAVSRHGEEWATCVVDRGRGRLRAVELGRRNGSMVEVLRRLSPGIRVILYPTDNVIDSVRAEIQ
jgi:hypothetical protein